MSERMAGVGWAVLMSGRCGAHCAVCVALFMACCCVGLQHQQVPAPDPNATWGSAPRLSTCQRTPDILSQAGWPAAAGTSSTAAAGPAAAAASVRSSLLYWAACPSLIRHRVLLCMHLGRCIDASTGLLAREMLNQQLHLCMHAV